AASLYIVKDADDVPRHSGRGLHGFVSCLAYRVVELSVYVIQLGESLRAKSHRLPKRSVFILQVVIRVRHRISPSRAEMGSCVAEARASALLGEDCSRSVR